MDNRIFNNKIVLITGAASGIGFSLAHALLAAGARVHASDLNEEGLRKAAIAWPRPCVSTQTLDVTDTTSLRSWIRDIGQLEGRIDYLFNNAGIGMAGEFRHMVADDWSKIIQVNLDPVFHGSHEGFLFMKDHGGGHLVNTASLLGITPSPLASLYSAAKHGVIGLSESIGLEGREFNIWVSAVCPGYIETAIFDKAIKRKTTTKDMLSLLPWTIYPADKAAHRILKGVARKQRRIIFPFNAKISYWAWLAFPSLYGWYNRRLMAAHRSAK